MGSRVSHGFCAVNRMPTDVRESKGQSMIATATSTSRNRLGRPNDETIQQERREQNETVVALRRMLAKSSGSRKELLLFSAA